MELRPQGTVVTRFAPSPTGWLHKGHAYSALRGYEFARSSGGKFLLRIEDIDSSRCTPSNAEQIIDDLRWLGIEWEEPIRYQSEHLADYAAVASQLADEGLLYPCFCTRKEIERELDEVGRAPHGNETPRYPGTCRRLSASERAERLALGQPYSLRLDLTAALERVGNQLEWGDSIHGPQIARPELLGDVILVRKDIGTSYHLAAVVDDGLQGVTDIVRGVDLLEATHLHRVLQALLGLPTPTYHHHPLLTDAEGRRLAKRDQSITLKILRERGTSAAELREELGFPPAITPP